MRTATSIALTLLLLPIALLGQTEATFGTGHFDEWLSGEHWGPDKQTFETAYSVRRMQATFTVARNGFGWHRTFTNYEPDFSTWEDVTGWCSAPRTLLFRTRKYVSPLGIYKVKPEDLVTIVDGYFRKYAPEAEASDQDCTGPGLRWPRPSPAAMSRIIELLEAASPEEP